MLKLDGVVVTGASKGIGLAVARGLAVAAPGPARVILCARDVEGLEAAAQELRGLAPDRRFEVLPMDVADSQSVADGCRRAREQWGPIDGLVLNAGIAGSAPLHRTDDALFERILATNVGGVFRPMRELLPGMVERGYGRVVAIGSIASKMGAAYISAYTASKHAVLGLVRSAAVEYARKGITVNLVCPGYVDTPMTDRSLAFIQERTGLGRDEALARIVAQSPQERLFRPEEVAAAVLYLLSDEAGGVNGATIDVDGGQLAG